MAALKTEDAQAEFRYYGGDLMQAQGGTLVRHYRDLAYMGFIPVLLHLRTILRGMRQCRQDILQWQPDVVILVDYPGFNLKIARFLRDNTNIPIFYYILPKLWAWKEYRIKNLRRDVDELFSILPFEVDFFEIKHHLPVHYVGNPSADEVAAYQAQTPLAVESDAQKPLLALLPGSRIQEIRDNLSRMLRAAVPFSQDYQLTIATAPSITPDIYHEIIRQNASLLPGGVSSVTLASSGTYDILSRSVAALVTSGTATLETALFRVPQVVCYYMKAGWLASLGKKLILKIPYISLVNLVAGREVVPELVADRMTVQNVRHHLSAILPGGSARAAQLAGYEEVARCLGEPGAPQRAAQQMTHLLRQSVRPSLRNS
jgi:lipid-A-disaccharide synthase